LRKPGPLTDEERQVMRRHCEIGYQALRNIPFLRQAAEIVVAHQEHYNGSGYPKGLRGEEIPLGARIFAVADALDAMISDRPYRKAMTIEEALEEIRRHSGTQFDPKVVEVFLSIPNETWMKYRQSPTGAFRLAELEKTSSGGLARAAGGPDTHGVGEG
jgi:HD-GYP domain-containing protein (c-di-GMP phosphodiesterase class II)